MADPPTSNSIRFAIEQDLPSTAAVSSPYRGGGLPSAVANRDAAFASTTTTTTTSASHPRDEEIPTPPSLARDPSGAGAGGGSSSGVVLANRMRAPSMKRDPSGQGYMLTAPPPPLPTRLRRGGTSSGGSSVFPPPPPPPPASRRHRMTSGVGSGVGGGGGGAIRPPSFSRDVSTGAQSDFSNDQTFFSIDYILQSDATTQFSQHVQSPVAISDDHEFFERYEGRLSEGLTTALAQTKTVNMNNNEVGVMGGAWRGVLRRLMESQYDAINALMLSRILQLFVPFLTGFEALICCQVIEALDSGKVHEVRKHLKTAMWNRNVSRTIVVNLGNRYDWLWHLHTWMTYNRLLDAWGQLPLVGITSFPASENFPATRNHALASIFRVMLGEGNWITRVLTGGREGLVTDDPDSPAQNLAAESNNFELANNSQYGTTHGRIKTNEFRLHHRLPTDESLIRTFVTNPSATTVNNGVMHVLLGLSRHWHNLLNQPWGNFAHQRMEQLDPFETLRFHVPQMLLLVTNLRGRNKWDADVLGPLIKKLQTLKPSTNVTQPTWEARSLAVMLKDMLHEICSGVSAWYEPFASWVDAIIQSFDKIEAEAESVFQILASVELGIHLGHDCMMETNWKIPSDAVLKKAILYHVKELKKAENDSRYRPEALPKCSVPKERITKALDLTTPRDKRTFIELVNAGQEKSKPAQLLLGRVKTLLQREIRRHAMNEVIRSRSVGEIVANNELQPDEWYWVGSKDVYACKKSLVGSKYRFMHVASGYEEDCDVSGIEVRRYNYVAESINRAQKAYMSIELYHGRVFKYNAFMEFPSLRLALLRLMVVGQMFCEELDNARVNVLKEIQRSRVRTAIDPSKLVPGKTYFIYDRVTDAFKPFTYKRGRKVNPKARIVETTPQSVAVIGGGPSGLMTVLHCTENCLASDGVMKLYEARDAFLKGGSTFERAQIVRLDARWIAMMRYHLGTTFENVYISLAGETDAQLGNTLPTQGFVEITIKNLESMLHDEITRLWSKGLISIYTESKSQYDPSRNMVLKDGGSLKVGDLIKRNVTNDGSAKEKEDVTWKVVDVIFMKTLRSEELELGSEYGVWISASKKILPFKLTKIDIESGEYFFRALEKDCEDLPFNRDHVPSIYPANTPSSAHGSITDIRVQCTERGNQATAPREETLSMTSIKRKKFALDVGYTHVVEAIGKPKDSSNHICITTKEPYGVACLQGLKVSYGMHNFGEKRFGSGLLDDIRSVNDQNTRIIGDFTKMVRVSNFINGMYEAIKNDTNWVLQFDKLVLESKFPMLNVWDPIMPKIKSACQQLAEDAPNWRRKTVQTRFFETGDNYYLGMEFCREYDAWKEELGNQLVSHLRARDRDGRQQGEIDRFRGLLLQYIDRLWYEGVLETIRKGDVYNPGARRRVPRLYLTDSHISQKLRTLPPLEAFRLDDNPKELYEILFVKGTKFVCRSVEGYVKIFSGSEMVKRESNLTRGPDGNAESKVALASFPVGHYVNHRTMIRSENDHVFAFVGDEQSTPHFMRYSGLTGACINAMSFNVFLAKAMAGVDFKTRYRDYSHETNWSNGEVVQRGTGANYGEDGFLRPGFPYRDGVNYLFDRLVECQETGQNTENMLSDDWKVKFAAALIPRGLEYNEVYLGALKREWHKAVFARFMEDLNSSPLVNKANKEEVSNFNKLVDDPEHFWAVVENDMLPLQGFYPRRVYKILLQCIKFARDSHSKDLRVSSSLFHQHKPVDSFIDDFAVEAQSVANSLTQSAAFAAGALALRLVGSGPADFFSALLAGLNILISFGTMANIARYKTRNEEARIDFYFRGLPRVEKTVFSLMQEDKQLKTDLKANPFYADLKKTVAILRDQLKYYNIQGKDVFDQEYARLEISHFERSAVRKFQHVLLTDFLAVKFYENSYVQESLVDLYRITNEILGFERPGLNGEHLAEELFEQLQQFKPRLKSSLQEGHVRWGFLKKRKLAHWDIFASLGYIRSLFYRQDIPRPLGRAPVEIETRYLAHLLRDLSRLNGQRILRRELLDLEACFWAHRESQVASLVFLMALSVFAASTVFTIARIFGIDFLEDAAFWAAAPSTIGAVLAAFHLVRKLRILNGLLQKIGRKKSLENNSQTISDYKIVMSATRHQIGLTINRLFTASTAAIVLPFSLGVMAFETEDNMMQDDSTLLPSHLAAVAVFAGLFSLLYFFLVEYVVRYHLPIDLGPFVCRIFLNEIQETYNKMTEHFKGLDSSKKAERIRWEYTARQFLHEYRFDTVFAADRFGQILQTIQGGLMPVASTRNISHSKGLRASVTDKDFWV